MPYKDRNKHNEYCNLRIQTLRNEWFAANGPCKCGSSDRLQVDHIDPAQKVSHRIWSWSEERRKQELAKCQVLCANCHMEKTLAQRAKAPHGKDQMYNKGCRCEICRAFKSRKNAQRDRSSKQAEHGIEAVVGGAKPLYRSKM